MNNDIIDEGTAKAALSSVRVRLEAADHQYHETTEDLRQNIVQIRPLGLVTVPQMAAAIGKSRNYIDTVWSASGNIKRTEDGSVIRTRISVDGTGPDTAEGVLAGLKMIADAQRRALKYAGVVRSERDSVIIMTYTSKILGPTSIASYLGIDRNHVLRIVRSAGVTPAHRTNIKNQHTASKQSEDPAAGVAVTTSLFSA